MKIKEAINLRTLLVSSLVLNAALLGLGAHFVRLVQTLYEQVTPEPAVRSTFAREPAASSARPGTEAQPGTGSRGAFPASLQPTAPHLVRGTGR